MANPIKIAAYLSALDESNEMIARRPNEVAMSYLRPPKKIGADEFAALTTKAAVVNVNLKDDTESVPGGWR